MEGIDPKNVGQFYIRVHKGDWEIEISALDEDFVRNESNRLIEQLTLKTATDHHQNVTNVEESGGNHQENNSSRPKKSQTIVEFFRQFKFQTNLEKTLVLGYWLEIEQGQEYFSSSEITHKYKEVRERNHPHISNVI